ncbi:MAG TPA: DUF2807 domain-containing protein [Flavobacterium sp.]|nr:DUF2807 domain-containing protein [Flavobacterium sp.]
MKKMIAVAFLSIMSISTFAQERKIKANGVVQEKNRRVQKYTKLVVDGEVIVEILNNPFNNVVRTNGDANLHQLIQLTVQDGVLTIKRKPGFQILNQTVPLKVSLATRDLTEITMNGDKGNISNLGAIEIPSLKLTNTGNGVMNLSVKTDELYLNTENNAAITVEGNSNTVKINSKSSGDINAKELSNFFTEVSSEGSGNIYTNTVNGIDGTLTGSGNLYYRVTKTVNVEEKGEGKALKL